MIRRTGGRQLSALPGLSPAGSATAVDELLAVGVRVAEVLAGAHRAGVVHGDVRAENIIVGGAEAVALVGWRDEPVSADPAVTEAGTDPRRDIRALATTLHGVLTGRTFVPGAPEQELAAHVPRELLTVLERAMGADPAVRYLSADTLAADLATILQHRREAVATVRLAQPTPGRRRFLVPLLLLAVGGAAAAGWLHLRQTASTWHLAVDDRFDQATASTRVWRAVQVTDYKRIDPVAFGRSGWRIVDGVLVGEDSQGRVGNLARTDLPAGAIRARWRITPQISPLNLNCFVGAQNRLDGYTVHVGGWGRADYVAVTRGAGGILDSCTLEQPLRAGATYEFALEFDRGELSFSIDGRPLLSCRDPEPLGGAEQGGLGFEVSWNTVRIDDLRIEVRPLDVAGNPLAGAEALASTGAWRRAAAAYQSFVSSQPAHALVPTARLRGAVALLRAGFADEALPVIAELGSHADRTVALQARFERLRALAGRVPTEALDGLVARLAEGGPDPTMARLALAACSDALAEGDVTNPERVLEQMQRLRRWSAELQLGEQDGLYDRWAELLNRLGQHAAVVEKVPEATAQHASALLALARYDEVHRRFTGLAWARYMAWSDTCGYVDGLAGLSEPFLLGRLLRESGAPAGDARITSGFDQAFALAQTRGALAAVQQYPKEVNAIAFASLGAGKPDEVLALDGITDTARMLALLQLGRLDEAGRVSDAESRTGHELRACRAIAALAANDTDAARRLAVVPSSFSWAYESRWSSHAYDPSFGTHFAAFVLPALIAWQASGQDPVPAWEALAATQTKRCSLRVDHRWQGLLGREDGAAILAQPFRAAGHPAREAALVAAIRGDLAKDPAAAERWRTYLGQASPFDVAARAWARFRLQRLGAEGVRE